MEETLNAMLDAEADQLCGAGRYERSQMTARFTRWNVRSKRLRLRPAMAGKFASYRSQRQTI